ncbi:zinc finger protein 235 isoform X1 [Ixodes scapularis]
MHIEKQNNQGDSRVQETPNQDTTMEVEEAGSDETRPHTDYKEHSLDGEYHEKGGEDPVTCSLCSLLVQRDNKWKHTLLLCPERAIYCELCRSLFPCSTEETHRYRCPKMARKCSDCNVNVLNEDLQNHLDTECQKRAILCDACDSKISYDERDDHDKECPEKPVVCDECEGEMPRKEKSKHASECPMRVVYCENCDGYYTYSSEKEHREQCEKKKLACEYGKWELKGDDEKNAHLEICEEALIECAFKDIGCNKKAPRREMQEHEKDPHNALLNQVILGLQERIEHLERPLTALVKKLRAAHAVGTSQ